MTAEEAPDCQRCGACCFSESEQHARVMGNDYERLGDAAEALVTFVGNRAFMRIVRRDGVGRCAALQIEGATFACSVYERRPDVCRELERGSPGCAGERATKGPRLVVLRSTPPA